jgi:hypothetical protein
LNKDPMPNEIASEPEFQKVMTEIENGFWKRHDKIREQLEEKELL